MHILANFGYRLNVTANERLNRSRLCCCPGRAETGGHRMGHKWNRADGVGDRRRPPTAKRTPMWLSQRPRGMPSERFVGQTISTVFWFCGRSKNTLLNSFHAGLFTYLGRCLKYSHTMTGGYLKMNPFLFESPMIFKLCKNIKKSWYNICAGQSPTDCSLMH